ncbi:hypothetical protein [Pelagicoccus sp. SDUM812002]|uniref:hypothetical protein n=1 Tax=Pelagicoccus sp. SDUM812002 TaxID=3041266 RepID=UPI00280D1350|nr:hypothetical protein [Pelagicoccus sp. SDUM812002]MDQ8185370.1 hypothetical protein [Pelagicoccus sp. SDUM812002]
MNKRKIKGTEEFKVPSPRHNADLDPDNATSTDSFAEREKAGEKKFYPEEGAEEYPEQTTKRPLDKEPKRRQSDGEAKIDEALDETFPASDPPSTSDPSRR